MLDAGLEAAEGAAGGASRPRAPVAVVAGIAWGRGGVMRAEEDEQCRGRSWVRGGGGGSRKEERDTQSERQQIDK